MFGKDYAAIHAIKPVVILNKPIYVGFTVLDLSKWKMYDFHKQFYLRKKKIIGKMKDEFGGVIITEFFGLNSIKKINRKEHNTAKGVKTTTEFDKSKDVLFNKKIIRHKMKRIKNKKT